ncbi:hypothetical protein J5N97_025261 [Dioscorea zingiberensis]|uniref:Uncharacterized protein n=1 Tax=Dioscorea zingiberensis TaxID=325984 RepID=A0A9D5H9H4_9LILI|nr:hypothetical protein J5N97_025261 [Dioscorea zingiberensis]
MRRELGGVRAEIAMVAGGLESKHYVPDLTAVSRLFFYDYPHPISNFTVSVLPPLKSSLSATLHHFYPLVRRFRCSVDDNTKFQLRYTDGDFILFTVTECTDDDFTNVFGYHGRSPSKIQPLVSHLRIEFSDDDPLLAVQITVFPNKVFVVGVKISHVACDERNFMHFIRSWVTACRGEPSVEPLSSFDRTIISIPETLRPCLDDWLLRFRNVCGDGTWPATTALGPSAGEEGGGEEEGGDRRSPRRGRELPGGEKVRVEPQVKDRNESCLSAGPEAHASAAIHTIHDAAYRVDAHDAGRMLAGELQQRSQCRHLASTTSIAKKKKGMWKCVLPTPTGGRVTGEGHVAKMGASHSQPHRQHMVSLNKQGDDHDILSGDQHNMKGADDAWRIESPKTVKENIASNCNVNKEIKEGTNQAIPLYSEPEELINETVEKVDNYVEESLEKEVELDPEGRGQTQIRRVEDTQDDASFDTPNGIDSDGDPPIKLGVVPLDYDLVVVNGPALDHDIVDANEPRRLEDSSGNLLQTNEECPTPQGLSMPPQSTIMKTIVREFPGPEP